MTLTQKQLGEIIRYAVFTACQPLLTRKDLASRYRTDVSTIDEWRRRKILPAPAYVGRFPFWSMHDISRAESQGRLRQKATR